VLNGLSRSFEQRPHLHVSADPMDVASMFDKNETCARLAASEIPIPPTLTATPPTPEALIDEVARRRWATAYVKLNTGSSASAIAVLRAGDAQPWATSSLIPYNQGFYSTRRLARLSGESLHNVLAFLISQDVCVQQGVRMAQIDGQNFDVRVVVIRGEVAFTIFRLSHNPMTNLHLGGQRGDAERCRAAIPTRVWLDGLDHCVEAARLYKADMVGIDLLFESGFVRHFLLEVNAFGDFFPNLTDVRGRGVHEVEIETTARALGWI
jgi:glutathione synthase/RimK-type ligase-like ATP-grasp enzyme